MGEDTIVGFLAPVLPVVVKSGQLDLHYLKEGVTGVHSETSSKLQALKLLQGMESSHVCLPSSSKDV